MKVVKKVGQKINIHLIILRTSQNSRFIRKKKRKNGRNDIVIKNDEYYICIENKIDTNDHDNQLQKYEKDLQNQNIKNLLLLYLSPFGVEPSEENCENWVCIEYQVILDILKEINEIKNCSGIIKDYIYILENNILIEDATKREKNDEEAITILNTIIIPALKKEKYSLVQRNLSILERFYSKTREKIEYEKNNKATMLWKNIIIEQNGIYKCFEFGNLKTAKTTIKYGEMKIKKNNLVWKPKTIKIYKEFENCQEQYEYMDANKDDLLNFIFEELNK